MKVMLFLGSGISFPSGLPNASLITNSLLNDEWHSHTDQNYYLGSNLNPIFQKNNWVLRIQPFLRRLKLYADNYYASRKMNIQTNYEDLFYMVQQLNDEQWFNIPNPMIDLFVQDFKKQIKDIANPQGYNDRELTLEFLTDQARNFIHCVVWHKLDSMNAPQGMNVIKDLALTDEITQLDIFSLNHDLLLEKLFLTSKINYLDGFGIHKGEVRYFDPSSYEKKQKIRLFKLHGSINWFSFKRKDNRGEIEEYGIPLNPDYWHCKDTTGNFIKNLRGKPEFLTGTYNKIFHYSQGIFAEMHYWLHRLLKEHNVIIMSGYGWNDWGINARLIGWILSSLDKRLFLLYENPEVEINEKSRDLNIKYWYDAFIKDGRLVPLNKWLNEANYAELMNFIKSNS